MTNLNNVVLEGRLVRDAQEGARTSADGQTQYGTFTLAVSKSKKDGDGWRDQTSFVDVKGFGNVYQRALPRLLKGTTARVVGSLEQEKWTAKDGQQRSKLVVAANQIFTEYRKDAGQPTAPETDSSGTGFPEDMPF